MLDVINGKIRARKWPRGKGRTRTKAITETQQKFAAAQQAAKYAAPEMMAAFEEATRKTPLYPRDIFTSMVYGRLLSFITEDGRKIYPVASRNDVSDALDAITQTEGAFVQRGPNGWEEGFPSGGGGLEFFGKQTVTSPVPTVTFTDLGNIDGMICAFKDVALSAYATRFLHVSTDNGATWRTTSGQYRSVDGNQLEANQPAIYPTGGTQPWNKTSYLAFDQNDPDEDIWVTCATPFSLYRIPAIGSKINAVRWSLSTGNFTSGTFSVWTI